MSTKSASDRVGARVQWRKALRVICGFTGILFGVAAGYFFRPLVIDWEDNSLHEQSYGNILKRCAAALPIGSSRKTVAHWVAMQRFREPMANLSDRLALSVVVATKPAADVCGPYYATINFDFDPHGHLTRIMVFPGGIGEPELTCEYVRSRDFP